jgi:hypothetical protein
MMNSGNGLNLYSQSLERGVSAVPQLTTGKYWKESFGFCELGLAGKIYPVDIQALQHAGDGCGYGRMRVFGSMYGVNS